MNEEWFARQAKRLPPGCMRNESSVATAKAIYGLVSLTQPRHAVEVGTCFGDTTVWIARAMMERKSGRCTSYDVASERLEEAKANLLEALGEEAPVTLVLEDITQREEPIACDFVFIDPDPKSLYIPVFEKLSMPLNATLCAHDLHWRGGMEHVQALRTKLVESQQWEVIGFPQERGLLVARKCA